MLTARLGFDETMNIALVKVKPGDTIAFEIKDPRNKWRWSLGVVLSQPMPRITEVELWKKRDKVLSEEERAKAKALQEKINTQRKDIAECKAAAQKRLDTLEEARRKVLEARANVEQQLSRAHEAMAKAKDEVEHIDDKDIREMRSYRTAPELVRLILEAVTLILESSGEEVSAKRKKVTWEDVQAKIRQPSFIRDVADFDASRLLQSTVVTIKKDYLSHARFNAEGARQASKAVQKLEAWVETQMLAFNTTLEVKKMQEEITVMDMEIAELEQQGAGDEDMVGRLEKEINDLEGQHEELVEDDDEIDYEAMDGTPSKAKKAEWMATNQKLYILTTSILSNLENTVEEGFDAAGGRTYRFDPTQVLTTARSGPSIAAMSASLPLGFQLKLPPGAARNLEMSLSQNATGSPVADLEKKIKDLESANQALRDERDELQKSTMSSSNRSTRNQEGAEDTESLKKALAAARASILELEASKEDLTEKMLSRGKDTASATERIREQLVEAEVKKRELESHIKQYQERHERSKADAAKLEEKLAAMEKERDESRTHTQNTLENLSRTMAKLGETTKQLEAASAEAKALKEQLSEDSSSMASAAASLAASQLAVATLEGEKASLGAELASMKAQLEVAKQRETEAEERVAGLTREQSSLKATLAGAQSEAAAARAELDALKQQLADAAKGGEAATSALSARVASLEGELVRAKEAAAASSRAQAEAKKQLGEARGESEALSAELESVRKQLRVASEGSEAAAALLAQVAALEAVAKASKVETENLRTQMSEAKKTDQAEIESSRRQVAEAEKRIAIAEESLAVAQSESLSLRKEADALKVQIAAQAARPLKEPIVERSERVGATSDGYDREEKPQTVIVSETTERTTGSSNPPERQPPKSSKTSSVVEIHREIKEERSPHSPRHHENQLQSFDASPSSTHATSHLCSYTAVDVSYCLISLALVLAVSVAAYVPAAIGFTEKKNTVDNVVVFYSSRRMGITYTIFKGIQAFVAFALYSVAPAVLNKCSASARSESRSSELRAHFVPYVLTLLGLALATLGAAIAISTNYIGFAASFGFATVFVVTGSTIMIQSTGVPFAFAATCTIIASELIGPAISYYFAPTLTLVLGLSLNNAIWLSLWISIVGLAAWILLVLTPYEIIPVLTRAASIGSSGYTVNRDTAVFASAAGNHPTTALGVLSIQFPMQWGALSELWNTDTQSLVAAGVAGSIMGIAGAFAQTALGFVLAGGTDGPEATGPSVSLLYVVAIAFTFGLQRALSRVLYFQGYPSDMPAEALVPSPIIVKLCGAVGVGLAIAASLLNMTSDWRNFITCILYGLAIAFGSQELLLELFPSQFYRKRSESYPEQLSFQKLRVSAVYTLLLLFVAYFMASIANVIVIGVGITQQFTQEDQSGINGGKTPSVMLAGMCALPLLLVIRGLLPFGKRSSAALHDMALRESRPLIESTTEL